MENREARRAVRGALAKIDRSTKLTHHRYRYILKRNERERKVLKTSFILSLLCSAVQLNCLSNMRKATAILYAIIIGSTKAKVTCFIYTVLYEREFFCNRL